MTKKSTFWAVALMSMSIYTAQAADIPVIAGQYFYLKSTDKYLALDGGKSDSVVVKTLAADANKASRDSALWEITSAGTETAGPVYQFRNKKTKAILSFAASQTAKPVLAPGVSKWTFTDGGAISAYLSNGTQMTLASTANGVVFKGGTATAFTVTTPESITLKPQDMGNGFSTFQLKFGADYIGNIFTGKDLIATSVGNDGFVSLQVKGEEAYPNGVKKYIGVDTLKTTIANATNVYGARFVVDSTRKVIRPNELCQHFKFTIDLQNDSLALFVAGAPDVNGNLSVGKAEGDTVRVVYAQTADTKVLTVSKFGVNGKPAQGISPLITLSKGTPATIAGGTGVYFLKSASKKAIGGQYISSYTGNVVTMGSTVPTVNQAKGQWYIKEVNGKYSVVDRASNTTLIQGQEVFAVQNMPDTYTFGSNSDSIKVEKQSVNLNDKYLGSLYFTKEELSGNGYVLNLIPGTTGVDDLYAYTTDSILKVKAGDAKDAAIFKFVSSEVKAVGGAMQLQDTLFTVSYKLKGLFTNNHVAQQGVDGLKQSATANALAFSFVIDAKGEKYTMMAGDKYVSTDITSSELKLSDAIAYFKVKAVDAPEYGTFANSHKELYFDGRSLTMNPANGFAEMKVNNGSLKTEMVLTNYFSLWIEKASTSTPDKPLYLISSGIATTAKTATDRRFYMVSGRDSSLMENGNVRVNFTGNDAVKTIKNSPALFAFKVSEGGGYYLENQKELGLTNGTPYVGYVNGVVVMQKEGAVFSVDNAPVPTTNDVIEPVGLKVIAGTGQLTIVNAGGKKISLSNILGQAIGAQRASSDYFIMPASKGVVFVSVEGETAQKVIVK